MPRNEVIIDGVKLTREQINRAYEQLNAPADVTITISSELAERLKYFMAHNITVPEALAAYGWALRTSEMRKIHNTLCNALNSGHS